MKKRLIVIILFSVLIISINDSKSAFAGVNTSDKDGDGFFSDPPTGGIPDPNDDDSCNPDPNSSACPDSHVIGGKIIPIDTTALLLAGTQTSFVWILPLLGVAGLAAFRLRKDLF